MPSPNIIEFLTKQKFSCYDLANNMTQGRASSIIVVNERHSYQRCTFKKRGKTCVLYPYWAEAGMVTTLTLPFDTDATALQRAPHVFGDHDTENFNPTPSSDDETDTDIGFTNVVSIPTFVSGTMIATQQEQREVETPSVDDLVLAKDDGLQPLCWTGQHTVTAQDSLAPIWIQANTSGTDNDLMVSPEHRILLSDYLADLLFSEQDVLVSAKELMNDKKNTRCVGCDVTYVQLMFDRHQIVCSTGLETKSYLPEPQATKSFDPAVVDDIYTLFFKIDPNTGLGCSPTARRVLPPFDVIVLRNAQAAA